MDDNCTTELHTNIFLKLSISKNSIVVFLCLCVPGSFIFMKPHKINDKSHDCIFVYVRSLSLLRLEKSYAEKRKLVFKIIMSFSSYFYTIYYNDTKHLFCFLACILHSCRDFFRNKAAPTVHEIKSEIVFFNSIMLTNLTDKWPWSCSVCIK